MENLNYISSDQIGSSHYLKSVTELGNEKRMVTTRDIYSSANIKLVAAGTRFDSSLYEKLLNHKLLPALDQCLSIENAVSSSSLKKEATLILQQDPRLKSMRNAINGGEENFLSLISRIPLNPAIAFKLTVMREKSHDLFQHSLFVAMVTSYIGMQMGLSGKQLENMATAGLLHDMSIMHVNPDLLEPSYRMSDTERNHLYAHPLTAWMILNEYEEYPKEVLDAILQHHERLDGSGYPRGLKEDSISLPGQILAVSEIIAGRHDQSGEYQRLRLGTILKFNSKRYGLRMIGHLKVFYQEDGGSFTCTDEDKMRIVARLDKLNLILEDWKARAISGTDAMLGFLQGRMNSLKLELKEVGLITGIDGTVMELVNNEPQTCAEIDVLVTEAIWRLKEIHAEIRRRWPKIENEEASPQYRAVRSWILDVEKILNENP